MLPKKAGKGGEGKGAAGGSGEAAEAELLAKLAEKELEAVRMREKLQRLTAAGEAADAEKRALAAEVEKQKANLKDINEYLTGELKAKAAKLAAAEMQLAAAQQDLEAAGRKAKEDTERAVQQTWADLARTRAELAAAQELLRVGEAFVAEKEQLQAQLKALGEEIDELKKSHHKKMIDLERKHAQDRELWKKDSVAAVKAAREEMMALTDNRLEITTKRTILENEQMSGELQYQSRQVQRLVQRNEALQRMVLELKMGLEISRRGEEELAKKKSLLERTAEALLVRLEEEEAEGGIGVLGEEAAAEYQEHIDALEEDLAAAAVQLEERDMEAARQGRELGAARRELGETKAREAALVAALEQCLLEAARHSSSGGPTGGTHQERQAGEEGGAALEALLAALRGLLPPQQERVRVPLLAQLGQSGVAGAGATLA